MSYWKDRMLDEAKAMYEVNAAAFSRDLENKYRKSIAKIEQKIDYYINRIAVNEELSPHAILQKLNNNEMDAFRMGVEEYIKLGSGTMTDEISKRLETASNLYHLNYYQAIGYEIEGITANLWGEIGEDGKKFLTKEFRNNHESMLYKLQTISGNYKKVSGISENRIRAIIDEPWAVDREIFSKRIWSNQKRLTANLRSELQHMANGTYSVNTAVKNISRSMQVSIGNAERLVQTELTHIASRANIEAFKQQGVKRYEYVSTLDNKTSPQCRSLDGKNFLLSDYEEGVTAPPHGAWCRSVIVPYYDDQDDSRTKRIYLSDDGKTGYTKAKTYKEWRKEYNYSKTDGFTGN